MISRRIFRVSRSAGHGTWVAPRSVNTDQSIAMEKRLERFSEISTSEVIVGFGKHYRFWSSSRAHFSNSHLAPAAGKMGDPTNYGKRFLAMQRFYSSRSAAEDGEEMEMVKKVGWLIKLLAAVTLTYVSFNVFPIMGDSLIWQSVALLHSEDPFMKRSGASRISLIATDDKRRKNFVEAGGIKELAKMLESAADDKTRREAVKALTSLCHCDVAVEALHETGAESFISSLANGALDLDVQNQAIALMKKLDDWKRSLNQSHR